VGEDGEKAAEPRRLTGGTAGGEEVTSANTYLQLSEDGDKAAELGRLTGGTGGGEEVTSASTYLQLGDDEEKASEQGPPDAWLEGLVEERR
jgi:hypothetical protein